MPYHPDPAFAALFQAFTGNDASIGAGLTRLMMAQTGASPLLVSTASDIALFPGGGAQPEVESFRKSTRGFIELTAVSHVPLALCYLARMRALDPEGAGCDVRMRALIEDAERVRAANSEALWRDHVGLRAFRGIEAKITAMVEYALAVSVDYMRRALADPRLLDFDVLRAGYLEARPRPQAGSMNDVMFATFCLAYIDIAYRIGNWLRERNLEWPAAMVLVSGQSGRPTAGVTWSSNNICNLIWQASDGRLPPERLYVAPHAPPFSAADNLPGSAGLAEIEQTCRRIWCHTRASVEVARLMFPDQPASGGVPEAMHDMPPIASIEDRAACVARLRRIMEDPRQLLSNCVADYVVEQLRRHGNRPEAVPVPGFSDLEYG